MSTIPLSGTAQALDRSRQLRRVVVPNGANSLVYLLLSNLILFAFRTPFASERLDLASHLAITGAIIAAIWFCISLVRVIRTDGM